MFRTINDFLESWKYESESTLKVFQNLTDESLRQRVTEKGRSLGFIAWHITQSIGEMMSRTGLLFPDYNEKTSLPEHFTEIISFYQKFSDTLKNQINDNWKDEMLLDDINMYGQVWKRAGVLSSLIAHQTHHRGQITVLMRQAGLKVPGVYGPAKEEWALYGMPEEE